MKKNHVQITASTKITMIFCACTVGFAVLLFTFLVFFPIKVDNPKNGINEKLIAAATTAEPAETAFAETTVTTMEDGDETRTETSFSFTRRTTDKEVGYTGTTTTRSIWQEPKWDYGYDNGYNNYQPVVTNPPAPVVTNPPATETAAPSTDAPVVDTDAPIVTEAPAPVVTEAPAPIVTEAPAPVVPDAPAENAGGV